MVTTSALHVSNCTGSEFGYLNLLRRRDFDLKTNTRPLKFPEQRRQGDSSPVKLGYLSNSFYDVSQLWDGNTRRL